MPFDRTRHVKNLLDSDEWVPIVNDLGEPVTGAVGIHGVVERSKTGELVGIDQIYIRAGHGFPAHIHSSDHILYVIEGAGVLKVGDESVVMNKGCSFYVPANLPHAMRAANDESLRVLAIGFPHIDLNDRRRMETVK